MDYEIIGFCKTHGIGCGDKMQVALHFIEMKGGEAKLEDIYQYCIKTLTKNPPTRRGLRAFFNKYARSGLLLYNDRSYDRTVKFKNELPKETENINVERSNKSNLIEEIEDETKVKKAQKHIQISIDTKRIIEVMHPSWDVYMATYRTGKAGKIYTRLEQESGEEFWSIRLRSWVDNRELKDPDVVVASGDKVIYLIEVKWGVIEGSDDTDILNFLSFSERNKNKEAREFGRHCVINGPAVQKGIIYRSSEFPPGRTFEVNDNTHFLLISDFQALMGSINLKKYNSIISELEDQKDICLFLNIGDRVDDIPSFREYLTQ